MIDNVKGSPTYGWQWNFSAGPGPDRGMRTLPAMGGEDQTYYYFGNITDESGLNKGKQPDFTSPPDVPFTLVANALPVGPLLNAIARERARMRRKPVPYWPFGGPNSNSFFNHLLGVTVGPGLLQRAKHMLIWQHGAEDWGWAPLTDFLNIPNCQYPGLGDDPWGH